MSGQGEQPDPSGQPGQPPSQPPQPPPYGQAGASWPNSQPAQPQSAQPPPTPPTPPSPAYGAPQQPPGPPGSPPYGAPHGAPYGYGGPYIPPPARQTSAGKIIAIVVGVVLLLTCGGCFAFGSLVYTAGRDVVREIESYEQPPEQVMSVAPGETFLVGDYSIAEGWSVAAQGPVVTIEGMRARKIGAAQYPTVAFDLTFYRAERLLGEATCTATVPDDGSEAEVACVVSDRRVRRADRVEIRSLV